MAETATKSANSDKAPPNKSLVPPEESFWQRYSAHHEAPLSGITSLAVHLLAIPLLLLVGWLIIKLGLGEDTKPLPVDSVSLVGGGGGSPHAGGTQGNDPDNDPAKDVETGPMKDRPDPTPPENAERKPLDPVKAKQIEAEFDNDAAVKRWVNRPTQPFDALVQRERETRDQLRKGVNPNVGKGGGGKDGGKDSGTDKGMGGGMGPGKASLNERERRILRWHMTFNTRNGMDYARQIQGLGGMVALPTEDPKRFLVIRDLSQRPVQMQEQSVAEIDQIFWIDDTKDSVYSLVHNGLGIKQVPPYVVAFFPKELEKRLLEIELEYQKKKTGTVDENLIHETKFNVVPKGAGNDVSVASQQYHK